MRTGRIRWLLHSAADRGFVLIKHTVTLCTLSIGRGVFIGAMNVDYVSTVQYYDVLARLLFPSR